MNTFRQSFPEAAGSRRVAFVVDDDRQVRSYIQTVLEYRNYIVMSFANPSDALSALIRAEGAISILISDVEMPEMNGIAFAGEVLRHFPELPVLIISGRADTEGSAAPLPFLSKPFLPDALMLAVEKARPPQPVSLLSMGASLSANVGQKAGASCRPTQ
ncbi:MAG: response regulator [Acidobacteriota bacterium]|nr:response regulator [Acidobacteriota bacterium]